MDNFKPRWGASFGISALLHCVVIAGFGLALHFIPVAPPKKDIVEVDLVDMGGGGGGGSTSDGPDIEAPEAESQTLPPPEEVPEETYEEDPLAENDVHEIREAQPEKKQEVKKTPSAKPKGHGSGGGIGDGHGTGVGPGTGSGSGGGNGSGHGTGNGSGEGPGNGNTMGPQLLSAPEPKYPESARRANIEGTTIVGLTIGIGGTVESAWVESTSGSDVLDAEAVKAVYRWRFVPAKQNGAAIEVNSRVPVTFRLH